MNVYRVNKEHWDLYGDSTKKNDYLLTLEQLTAFSKIWEKPLDELLGHCEEEQYEYHCEMCNHFTDNPKHSTTTEGTDADGNRGWKVTTLDCPRCGCNY